MHKTDTLFWFDEVVWVLYGSKFTETRVAGIVHRPIENDFVYFLACEKLGEAWYLESQLFETKQELIESMSSEA